MLLTKEKQKNINQLSSSALGLDSNLKSQTICSVCFHTLTRFSQESDLLFKMELLVLCQKSLSEGKKQQQQSLKIACGGRRFSPLLSNVTYFVIAQQKIILAHVLEIYVIFQNNSLAVFSKNIKLASKEYLDTSKSCFPIQNRKGSFHLSQSSFFLAYLPRHRLLSHHGIPVESHLSRSSFG